MNRLTARQRRQRRATRQGWLMLTAALLITVVGLWIDYLLLQAHWGIS